MAPSPHSQPRAVGHLRKLPPTGSWSLSWGDSTRTQMEHSHAGHLAQGTFQLHQPPWGPWRELLPAGVQTLVPAGRAHRPLGESVLMETLDLSCWADSLSP